MPGITIRHRIFLIALITGLSLFQLQGQDKPLFRSLKLTLGGGYGNYFNTFKNVLDEDVKNLNPSFFGRLTWEPEHRLKIGFESGYYMIYSTSRLEVGNTSRKLTTNMSAVPLFLVFGMKLTDHLDFDFSTGGAIINYNILTNNSKKNTVKGSTLSLADFAAGITWHIPLGKRFEIGSELKYMYLGKTADNHLSAFIDLSYRLVRKPVK